MLQNFMAQNYSETYVFHDHYDLQKFNMKFDTKLDSSFTAGSSFHKG